MKKLLWVLVLLLSLTLAATPAFAQGSRGGDHVCMGGNTLVSADETPDSVVLFGCGARIQSGAQIRKDVVSFGGNVVIEKGVTIEGDVVVFGGNVDMAGEVKRDVTLFGGNVTLQSNAIVGRDVVTMGGALHQQEGATIRGRITRGTGAPILPSIGSGVLGGLFGLVTSFVKGVLLAFALAVLAALTLVFLPKQTHQVVAVAQQATLPSLGVGCLTALVVPILMVPLLITCIGTPLLGVAFIVAILFGWIAMSWLVGEKALDALKAKTAWREPLIAAVVGIFLLAIVTWVPIAGGLVGLFVATLGLGAVVLTRFGTRNYPYIPAPVAPPAPLVPPTSMVSATSSAPVTPKVAPPPDANGDPSI